MTGVLCDINIDECASHKCKGESTCVDGMNSYTCLCPPGMEGEFCGDDIYECISNTLPRSVYVH